jgi:Ca-activated chloride channel family protein
MSEQPQTGGLLAGELPEALDGLAVDAEIEELCARGTVAQRYRNRETQPIEAVYVFPLDDSAAVCGFEVVIDGTHVVGEVQERERAFETYDDALAEGHGAYLLDQERPDVFVASIGNVPAGKEVLVRITYVTELRFEGDAIRFTLPTTVAPRYAPAEDRSGVGPSPALTLNPPLAFAVPYGLELEARVALETPIRGLESPSHPVAVECDGGRAVVRLASRAAALDRDFVLLVRRDDDGQPRALVERHPNGQTAAMVCLRPRFDAGDGAAEIIFVIDRSGSMAGDSIDEARRALQLCLRSLPEGARFNIVGFGSSFASLFPTPRPLAADTLRMAAEHVEQLDADLGGTEILAPLATILGEPPPAGQARQLVVLTDGEVTNTQAVISLLRRHAGSTRVFAFGVGASPSHHLVRGMARAGGGAAEFIVPGERFETKVIRQLGRMLAPALTDVGVEWAGVRARRAPETAPAVFAGDHLLLYGFIDGESLGEVIVRGTGPNGTLSWSARVDARSPRPGTLLATLAARALIRDLEDGVTATSERGSRQRERHDPRIADELVRLGVSYGLVSSATSFVAVERRQDPSQQAATLRRVRFSSPAVGEGPVRTPSRWPRHPS